MHDAAQRLEPGVALGRASGSLSVLSPLALLQGARASRRDLRLVLRHARSGAVVVVVFRAGEPTMVFSPGDGRSLAELLVTAGLLDRQAVDGLLQARVGANLSLQRLLLERTNLSYVDVQQFFDFQGRQRLLDALAWEDGFFQLEEYSGGEETGYCLALPSFESLAVRAAARQEALPALLAALPAAPGRTLVRRRRGALRPLDSWEREVFEAVERPMLLPQLVARLLVDDDLVLGAVLRLAERRQLALEAVAAAVGGGEAAVSYETRVLFQDVAAAVRQRRGAPATDLWVLVLSARLDTAPRLVAALGGNHHSGCLGDEQSCPVARGVVIVGERERLVLVAARPDALSRGALEGLLGRCDAVALVREVGSEEEGLGLSRLRERVLAAARHWRPVVLGVDLGAGTGPWVDPPDAVIGLPRYAETPAARLVEHLLSGILAAAKCRGCEEA